MQYQILAIDNDNGIVYGKSFDDPLEALAQFVHYGKNSYNSEVLFHKHNSTVVTVFADKLSYAIVEENASGGVLVDFHTDCGRSDVREESVREESVREYNFAEDNPDSPFRVVKRFVVSMKTGDVLESYNLKEE